MTLDEMQISVAAIMLNPHSTEHDRSSAWTIAKLLAVVEAAKSYCYEAEGPATVVEARLFEALAALEHP